MMIGGGGVMRRAIWCGAGATIVVAVELAMCVAPPSAGAAGPRRGAATAISYRGLHLRVPAGWPVYRLDAEPGRCVRFDRHALYLGRGGPDPDCPARLAGRTEAVQVEPMDPADGSPPATGGEEAEGEMRYVPPAAGLVITATYGARRSVVQQIIRSARIDPAARLRTPRVRSPRARVQRTKHARQSKRARKIRRRAWAVGRGFDTCTAPSLQAMRAWRRAYRIANIYIGGAARACGDGNLSRGWIRLVRRMGYRLIPTYVGVQAPCTRYGRRFRARNAARAGVAAANDAVLRARALGIGRTAPIYFDMEAYDSRRRWCRRAVLRFLHSWSRRLRVHHYTPGVYSSVASGIRDLGLAKGISKPSSIWFAHWDKRATTMRSRYLLDSWWRLHRRIKQFRGPHREKHGGYAINVDSDVVDGRVY
jgi:hypothetical protein